jgi:HSP20 family protein
MADKVSEKLSGSGSLGEMANKVADKVSEKFSGSDRDSGREFSDNQSSTSNYNRSSSNDYSQPLSSSSSSNDYNRASNDYEKSSESGRSSSYYSGDNNQYSGNRSYEGGSSSRSGGSGSASSSSSGTLGDAFNKMSDKISEGSSTIGQTLHKISDKISETFSGSGGQSESRNRSSEVDSSSQGKMMTNRRNRRDSSALNPFDLSSFFRGNFLDNLSETFSGQALSMRTDVIERDSDYQVICDLPGVDKKDINISLRKNYLEIHGERNEGYDQDNSDQTVHCQERYYGSFTRRLSLPDDAAKDMSGIKARCEKGVLTVTIPKSQQTSSRDRYNINIE